ncbi:MAG: beta-lactamase family protein [Hyphomonadaceae bacterium]|nr:beta-lactamase family protein [Hyphomonadaceae bacterium]
MAEASSQIEGFVAPGFERVRETLSASFAAGEELGASFAAIRDGEVVVNLWGGHADRQRARPFTRDTLTAVHSTTKAIAAIVAASLQDTHGLDLEAPVASVWPAFSAHGKGRVTIAQALAHQAGVPGFPDPIDPLLWLDHDACAAAIAALQPMWPPGSASGYHPVTWGYIAGEIVRRVAGRTLGVILREDICAPRGIDFWIGLPEEHDARVSEQTLPSRIPDFGEIDDIKRAAFLTKWAAPDGRSPLYRRVEIPSANGFGTALAVAQLYDIYVQRGGDVLSPRAFDKLVERRYLGPDLVLPFALDWRAGVLGNSNLYYGPDPNALGHSGRGGSCGFADPAARVAGGYVMNKHSPNLMGDPRALTLIGALYECL